ncbi:STAS-like domain-containing protein [uncultured Ilyobacter sp.]|uniref:STAS-like domain-containing protein n=1 Tax=uncultured Ilyobacter sp. TaxID=544433 RepID=UPI0029C8659A|nr:STAS-like domain-containing protein [uncultured Ilyobacter sp.]
MTIKIINFIDHDPSILFEKISESLEKKKNIILDFYSLESLNYSFLEESIGRILDSYTFESLQFKITFRNVDVGIKEMLTKIIKEKSL